MHVGARLVAMGRTESPASTLCGLVTAGRLHTRPHGRQQPALAARIPQPSPTRIGRDAWTHRR